jgi:hypothetical protein
LKFITKQHDPRKCITIFAVLIVKAVSSCAGKASYLVAAAPLNGLYLISALIAMDELGGGERI